MASRTARPPLILASGSPYRRKMLEAAGLTFRVVPAEVDEAALKGALGAQAPKPGPAAIATALAHAKAQAVSVPCEVAGQFYPQTDRDWVTFQAKAGEALWIEVLSQRLGLPTDPHLLVQQVTKNDKGELSLTFR